MTDCGECLLHEAFTTPAAIQRRDFLHAAGLIVASLGLFGGTARSASALVPGIATFHAPHAGDRAEERRYPIPAADGVSIDRDNSIIIARAAGKVCAFSLACPHQNTALRWDGDDHEFQCPKHKSHYRADGAFIQGRATRDMDRMAIRRDGSMLVVNVDVMYQSDDNPKEWSAAVVTV